MHKRSHEEIDKQTDFEKAVADQDFALNLYLNEAERAYLAEKWFALLKAVIQNPNISVEDAAVITSTFPKKDVQNFHCTKLHHTSAISRHSELTQ